MKLKTLDALITAPILVAMISTFAIVANTINKPEIWIAFFVVFTAVTFEAMRG